MAVTYVSIPLYSDEDYEYQISLEGIAYIFRCYYNNTASTWYMDLSFENGDIILSGIALVPNYPITYDYVFSNLFGYFFLEPIENINTQRYKTDPTSLSQYYRFFYIYENGV